MLEIALKKNVSLDLITEITHLSCHEPKKNTTLIK